MDESKSVRFRLRFDGHAVSHLSFRSALIHRLPRGHRQYLTIQDALGNRIAEKMLDANNDGFESDVVLPWYAARVPGSFADFLLLGVEHILTGYDHVVFLVGLLIAGGGFRQASGIITSFTVAHSVTLGLATLDVIRLSPRIVEPLVAVSIIYVGVENILRSRLTKRWLLTFGFGLVHGFGFASVLTELGIGAGGVRVAAPLLSFNLGVELGQIAIAALALPLIWKLKTKPRFAHRFVPVCSILVAVMGGLWLVERALASY